MDAVAVERVNESDSVAPSVNGGIKVANNADHASSNSFTAQTLTETAQAATSVDLTNSTKEEDIDPFTYHPPFTKWDYLKISINALWLFPLRLIFVVIPTVVVGILACLMAIMCDRYNEDDLRPLNRWGRFVMGYIGTFITRIFLFGFGFNWIRSRGRQVSTKEAPILVVSPHSCLLDIFVISRFSKFPTFLARSSVKDIPLIGMLITRTMRTIYVERQDPESRMKAAEEIRRRTHTRGEWPKVLLFPEGTTTNTKVLISFKQGAFIPRLPVQPVLIKYKNKLNTTTWGEDGLGVLGSLFLTLCQFHNSLEVEFLPVYHPSDEEMHQPKLFARNVQVIMAKAMGVPHTNHAFEDVLLMRSARKAGLPFRSGMVVYQKANSDLNMDLSAMKKWLHRFIAMDSDKDGFINVDDFAKFLQVSNDAKLQAVFNAAEVEGGKLSFRSYLYGVVGKARPLLQDASFMQAMFNFFDSDGDGIVSEADLSSLIPVSSLPHCHDDHREQKQEHDSKERLVNDETNHDEEAAVPEEMNLDQFITLLDNHPEYALIFQESQHSGVSGAPNISASHVQPNGPLVDHSSTKENGQNSASNSHMTQPANENGPSSSTVLVEAEIVPQLSLLQTTVTIEVEEH